ncbi:MAG: histidine phosphatase family protein [Deltaproteobacteria bacterium]|nr:histidine phosphatase family protein [Deltaproteobacteria bacterium]
MTKQEPEQEKNQPTVSVPAEKEILITLVRHGETYQNRHKIVQGQDPTQGRLTPEGLRQAALLGSALAGESFDIVYCSPLERAVLTMSGVLAPREGKHTLPIVFTDELKEINQGVLHGRTHQEWKDAMSGQDPIAFCPSGGESWLDVQERVSRYLSEVILSGPGRNIMVVAHGGVNRGLIAGLTGIPMAEMWKGPGQGCPQDNACINRLTISGQGALRQAVVNDTRHLAGEFEFSSSGQRWIPGENRWELLDGENAPLPPLEFDPYS